MASNQFSVYDFDQYVITLNGIIFEGWADGTALNLVKEADSFTDMVGLDGSVARSKSLDNRWTATASLMQTSGSNLPLSLLLASDENLPNGAGVGVFLVKDLQGTSLFVGNQAWIHKQPDWKFERTPTSRDWVIRIAHGVSLLGGN